MAGQEAFKAWFREEHERRMAATQAILEWWANDDQGLAATAQRDAKWIDRTSNARQSIIAYVEELTDSEGFQLFLKAGGPPPYSLFLELAMAGKYAVLWPTIERALPQIVADLERIWGRRG
jgi:hypothetical protein